MSSTWVTELPINYVYMAHWTTLSRTQSTLESSTWSGMDTWLCQSISIYGWLCDVIDLQWNQNFLCLHHADVFNTGTVYLKNPIFKVYLYMPATARECTREHQRPLASTLALVTSISIPKGWQLWTFHLWLCQSVWQTLERISFMFRQIFSYHCYHQDNCNI